MAATKRNLRKSKKTLRRKGGKKTRHTRSRRTARGHGDIQTVDRASAPLAARTSVPTEVSQLIKVSFAATRAHPPRVRIDWDGTYELTMPTDEYTYARTSTLSKSIMKKHDNFTIIDLDTGDEIRAKFAGFTPTDLYFYQV